MSRTRAGGAAVTTATTEINNVNRRTARFTPPSYSRLAAVCFTRAGTPRTGSSRAARRAGMDVDTPARSRIYSRIAKTFARVPPRVEAGGQAMSMLAVDGHVQTLLWLLVKVSVLQAAGVV